MISRKIDTFLQEFFANDNKALLITGARQTGKTFSIRQFGTSHYTNFVEINFIDYPEAATAIAQAGNSNDILFRLSALTQVPLVKGQTLIFFDEVQECPQILTYIKFLVDEGSYRYVLSGSLLGVTLKDLRSAPVGYLCTKHMFPLDFEEFINALGIGANIVDKLRSCFDTLTPVDTVVHNKLLELFRLYLIVGGMPAVVSKYIETNNLRDVTIEQQAIINLYKMDIAKYDKDNKLYIEEIFDLIPPELNSSNKRFILKNINENLKFSRYENSFLWLKDAGVALPVYNIEEPKSPLLLARSRNLFKLFQSDIGLLACQYADGIQLRIINGDNSINYGAVYENAVAQELNSKGFNLYYYNNKRLGEVDFLVEKGGHVLPIEVKSGKDYTRHRALSNILSVTEFDIKEAFVLSNENISTDGSIIYLPVYMAMFIDNTPQQSLTYTVDISML